MWLLIDDKRDLNCDIIARTYEAGKAVLEALEGHIEVLCIDHDLGNEEKSGYDLINWAIWNNKLPKGVQIVSSNSVGKENIERALINYGYIKDYKDCIWKRNNSVNDSVYNQVKKRIQYKWL